VIEAADDRKRKVRAFVRTIVAEILAAEANGLLESAAIADHLNAKRITTRKGRTWNAVTVEKFLSSPGAHRFRAELEAKEN